MKRLHKFFAVTFLIALLTIALAATAGATELKTGIGTVTASSLRLRAKNNTGADILTNAANGDQVVVLRKVGDWYLVDYNLYIGYMHADYITVKDRENIDLGNGSINPAVVNLRSGPATSSSVVTQVSGGALVDIIGFNCNWYKVVYNGQTGYIRSDLVTLTEKPSCNSGTACSTAGVSTAVTAQRRPDTGIGKGQRDGTLQHTLRAEVFAEEWISHAHIVHKERRQQEDHHQQNGVLEVSQRLQPLCGKLLRGDFVQQLLKPAKGAQKAADEASQQDAQQDEKSCDIIGEAEL